MSQDRVEELVVLWSIGEPQGGTEQFADGALFDDTDEIIFRMGSSDVSKDWPWLHPGPLHASTGYREKTIAVEFSLADEPAGTYELYLRIYALQGPAPQLRVVVNGEPGVLFPDPVRLDRTDVAVGSTISGWAELHVPLRAPLLQQGENRLAITTICVDPPDVTELSPAHPAYPWLWGSTIQYGCVRLVARGHCPLPAPTCRVMPLPLFVRDGAELLELTDIIVGVPAGLGRGTVRLSVGETTVEGPLEQNDVAFGEARARLRVPDQQAVRGCSVEALLGDAPLTFQELFRPCRKWTVHLLPHVHLDLGFTDYQAKVTEVHTRNLDRALGILEALPTYAYSVDGSYVVQQFLRTRSKDAVAALVRAMREKRISVNAFFALFLTGLATLEECYRAGYQLAELRRESGIVVDYANLTDVPSYSGSLPSVLSAMGLDSFLGIQNHARAATEGSDELHLQSPFQWEGPDGTRVLAFFADAYGQLRGFCGYPTTVTGCADALTRLLRRYERDDYLPSDFPLVGIYSDNEDLAHGEASFVERWSSRYVYPKMRYSTASEYFEAVRPLREELPVVRGDGGSYWEDGVGAGAAVIAAYRRAQISLPVAETCTVLARLVDASLEPAIGELDRAWDSLLVGCEHTWTSMHASEHPHSHTSVDQLAWKAHHVASAARIASDETRRALSQLAERFSGQGPGMIVCNSSSRARSGTVDVELEPGHVVVDELGSPLPLDVGPESDGLVRARFDAGPVPAFGCRRYAIVAREAVPAARSFVPLPDVLETTRYTLTSDPSSGRVTGIRSRTYGRELLDPTTGFALAELLYVSGPTMLKTSTLWDSVRSLTPPDLEIVRATMRPAVVCETPWGVLVRCGGEAPSLPSIETTIELRDNDDRVDITVELTKERRFSKESVYLTFPFALDAPRLYYDRQQGWVDPSRDHLPGACNEWFTTQYGVGLADDDGCVVWTSADAPLFTVGDVVRGTWPLACPRASGTILSWVMNNYWFTNYPSSQEGDLVLHYSFTPCAGWDPSFAAHFGRNVRTPLAATPTTWIEKMTGELKPCGSAPEPVLSLDAPEHTVVTLAAARASDGLLARVQELEGLAGSVRIAHPLGPRGSAYRCTALEDQLGRIELDNDGWLSIDVRPFEVVTALLT